MSRNKVALLVSGCLIVGAAVACGHKVDHAKNDKAKATTTKTGADKIPTGGPGSTGASTSDGGFPGTIDIGGVVVQDGGNLVDGIDKSLTPGLDSKGQPSKNLGSVHLVKDLSAATQAELKATKDLKNYVNINCSENQLKEFTLPPKEEKAQIGNDGVLAVTANLVAICDILPENAKIVRISADTLMLSSSAISIKATAVENVLLKTNRLFLRGSNKIEVTETVAAAAAPELSRITLIVAEKLDNPSAAEVRLVTIGANAGQAAQATPPTAPKSIDQLAQEAAAKAEDDARAANATEDEAKAAGQRAAAKVKADAEAAAKKAQAAVPSGVAQSRK